jgi:hypothetical protein
MQPQDPEVPHSMRSGHLRPPEASRSLLSANPCYSEGTRASGSPANRRRRRRSGRDVDIGGRRPAIDAVLGAPLTASATLVGRMSLAAVGTAPGDLHRLRWRVAIGAPLGPTAASLQRHLSDRVTQNPSPGVPSRKRRRPWPAPRRFPRCARRQPTCASRSARRRRSPLHPNPRRTAPKPDATSSDT